VPQGVLDNIVILSQSLLHGSHSLKVSQVLALISNQLSFFLLEIVGNRVNRVKRVIFHQIDIIFFDLFTDLEQM
jgi:hypothetical protein